MLTRLTLSLDKQVVKAAKKYARERNTTVSKLVENYLKSLVDSSDDSIMEVSPLVKSLSGVLKLKSGQLRSQVPRSKHFGKLK